MPGWFCFSCDINIYCLLDSYNDTFGNNTAMIPQALMTVLLHKDEQEGQRLLYTHVPTFNDDDIGWLVKSIKRESERQWNYDPQISFMLAGHLLTIGELTRNQYYHALGLMARGDALRRMDRYQDALRFLN